METTTRQLFKSLSRKAEFLAECYRPDVIQSNSWTVPELIMECEQLLNEIKERESL